MYIGNAPIYQSFITDTFSGTGSTTVFTMSVAPANTPSVLISISGVVQDPSTYSVSGTTLTFSGAPPAGTGNISVRYLGVPASGVTTTAYRTVTEFTATASQTTFTPASYTPGFINVYQNGALLGSADYTATNGTTVVLAVGATVGDLIVVESFYVSSVLNAIPATSGSISSTYLAAGSVGTTQIASGAVTPTQLNTQAQYTGFKNRIINGAMSIDQRNAGASITPTTSGDWWGCDRWRFFINGASSKFSTQQSTTAPTGFINSTLITSLSAYSVASTDNLTINQIIEGLNVSDLGWGTANAQTVTLSFWVRSSLTGTFGGSLKNSASDRSYPFTYTINAANTWEKETITIPGDTSGTWLTTNGVGIRVGFNIGSGSTFLGTANTWAGANYTGPTGATSIVGTNGATFYITGVQLEVGSTATSFDYRSIGTELALCQRYCYVGSLVTTGNCDSVGNPQVSAQLPVSPRATPTLASYSGTWRGALLASITNLSINSSNGVRLSFSSTQSGTANSLVSGGGGGISYNLSMEL